MSSDTRQLSWAVRAKRWLALTTVLGLCVLACACMPAGAAKLDRTKPSGATDHGAGAPSPQRTPAEHGEQAAGTHEGRAGGHEQDRASTEQDGGRHEPERGSHGQVHVRGGESQAPGSPESDAGGGGAQHGSGEQQGAVATEHGDGSKHERAHESGGGGHEHGPRKGEGSVGRGHEQGNRTREQGDRRGSAEQLSGSGARHAGHGQRGTSRRPAVESSAAPGVAARVSSAPLPAAPTAVATPLVAATAAPGPAVSSMAPGGGPPPIARRYRQARTRVAGRRGARGAPTANQRGRAGVNVSAPAAAGGARLVAATVVARRPADRASAHGRPSAIVTTITRIVGVVPTSVWILLGAMFALALALAAHSRLTTLRARRLRRQRAALLEDVGLLQAALLPMPPARLGPVATSAAYRPADGPAAGGDFYDMFAIEDGRIAVILGDVSGHGRQALPHTALIRFTLRAYLEAGMSPREALQTAGEVLDRQLGGYLVSVVAAAYQPRERTLVYACAGHPPPMMLGSEPIVPLTACSAPPIGAGMRTGTRQSVVHAPGWLQVCLHTDGLTDARVAGELFGAQRLESTLAELGPRTTAPALLERVVDRTSTRPDDMAACLLHVEGGAGAPRIVTEELELDRDGAASDRAKRFLLACGVEGRALDGLVRSAREIAESEGAALIELRLTDGSPQVSVRGDNVAYLDGARAARRAGAGVSR
jgi:hypothetical protein